MHRKICELIDNLMNQLRGICHDEPTRQLYLDIGREMIPYDESQMCQLKHAKHMLAIRLFALAGGYISRFGNNWDHMETKDPTDNNSGQILTNKASGDSKAHGDGNITNNKTGGTCQNKWE